LYHHTATPQRPDLNAHGLPPLSASRVFNSNCQLAFIYGHVTLLLQLIYSFHDVPAQLLGLLRALHAYQKQHSHNILIALVPEGQADGQSLFSIQEAPMEIPALTLGRHQSLCQAEALGLPQHL